MKKIIHRISVVSIIISILAFIPLVTYSTKVVESSSVSVNTPDLASPKESPNSGLAFERFPINQPLSINFSLGTTAPERLTKREQRDQMLDWLLFTVTSNAGLTTEQINHSLFDLPPIRYAYTRPLANFEYGDTRSALIGDNKIVALIPTEDDGHRTDYLAYVADLQRNNTSKIPKTIEVFEYKIDTANQHATLTKRTAMQGQELFTPSKGYYETSITNLDDLKSFLSQIHDVTYVHRDEQHLTLGGRKLQGEDYLGVKVEDIAAIWQAQNETNERLQTFNKKWSSRCEQTFLDYTKSEACLRILTARTALSDVERRILSIQLTQNDADKIKQLIKEHDTQWQELGPVGQLGFSLDPYYDFAGLQQFFTEQKPKYTELIGKDNIKITATDIEAVEKGLQQKDALSFLQLVDLLKRSESETAWELADTADEALILTYRYQAARYDGNLQGTEVGMTLFYTDLLAKLWALNFKNSIPTQIEDFTALTTMHLPNIYERELYELPSTRLWFGPQHKGVQVGSNDTELFFSRAATRVYAASSNPLNPGVEVQPNAQSDRFLGWWNDHFGEVAYYEPQYQRLNEIMKWSLLISWLNKIEKDNSLTFLARVKVDHSQRFPDWVHDQKQLRFGDWEKIQFYQPGYLNTKTEALPILKSNGFSLFPDDVAVAMVIGEGARNMYGGVSLGDLHVFEEVLPISSRIDDLAIRSGLNFADDISVNGLGLRTLDDISYNFTKVSDNLFAVTSQVANEIKLRSIDSEIISEPLERLVTADEANNSLMFEARMGEANLGTLEIQPTTNGFAIGWQSREIDLGQQVARELSTGEILSASLVKDSRISTVIELPGERNYLLQFENSDRWLHISAEDGQIGLQGQSRVADPQKGRYNMVIDWKDSPSTAFNRGGYLVKPSADGASWQFTAETLPEGLRPLKVKVGELNITGHIHPETRKIYFPVDELPAITKEHPELLKNIVNSSEIPNPLPNVVDYELPESVLDEHSALGQALAKEDYEAIGQRIALNPTNSQLEFIVLKKMRLQQIDTLIRQGHSAEALEHLDELTNFFGDAPEFTLRKGLLYLEQDDLPQTITTLNKSTNQLMDNPAQFFDEVNLRLQNNGLTNLERDNVYRLAEYADWHDLEAQQLVPTGRVQAVSHGDRIELEYYLAGAFEKRPVSLNQIDRNAPFYVQDSPSLNNLDWHTSFGQSLHEAISGDLGEVILLPREDIAHFNPTRVYAVNDDHFDLVTQSTRLDGGYTPIPNSFPTSNPLPTPTSSTNDTEKEVAGQFVYIVVAKK